MFDDVNKKARLRNGPFLCKKDMTLCIMMFESRNEMSVNKHLQQNVRRLLGCYSLEMERERRKKGGFKIRVASFSIHVNPIQFSICVFQLNVAVWHKVAHCSVGHTFGFSLWKYCRCSVGKLETEIHVMFM